MNRAPITKAGVEQLKAELKRLKTEERPKIIDAVAEARAHGDLKENAEYHAAREQQAFIEGRIAEVEAKLANAQVIDVRTLPATGKVIFGVTVTIVNVDTDEEKQYQIVGDDEADIKQNRLSVSSPIARGLIGKHEGDEIEVEVPGGVVEYEILKVEHV